MKNDSQGQKSFSVKRSMSIVGTVVAVTVVVDFPAPEAVPQEDEVIRKNSVTAKQPGASSLRSNKAILSGQRNTDQPSLAEEGSPLRIFDTLPSETQNVPRSSSTNAFAGSGRLAFSRGRPFASGDGAMDVPPVDRRDRGYVLLQLAKREQRAWPERIADLSVRLHGDDAGAERNRLIGEFVAETPGPLARAVLEGPDPGVRGQALVMLAEIGEAFAEGNTDAVGAFFETEALTPGQLALAKELFHADHRRQMGFALHGALDDANPKIRVMALATVSDYRDLFGQGLVRRIAEMAGADPSPDVRMQALEFLVGGDPDAAWKAIDRALADPDVDVAELASDLLKGM